MSSNLPTIVLTGASAGIGLAALQALAQQAFIVAVARTSPPIAIPNGLWLKGDLQDAESVTAHITRVLRAHELSLDGLIHCAVSYGADRRHGLMETSTEEWNELMAVNVGSQFLLTARLLPLLLGRPRAFIVAVTSDAATKPAPHRIAYGCSKAASYALFSGLAAELSESTVSVIQVMPERQVATRGLRRRRPPDFDFSSYSSPDIFAEPLRSILRTRGAGLNGTCQLVSDPSKR